MSVIDETWMYEDDVLYRQTAENKWESIVHAFRDYPRGLLAAQAPAMARLLIRTFLDPQARGDDIRQTRAEAIQTLRDAGAIP